MFSTTVEYALRAAVYLASKYGQSSTTEEVAEHTQVPGAYLAKILQGLSRAGLVRSQRGVGGGVSLAKSPEVLTVLDIINAVEPFRRLSTEALGKPKVDAFLSGLHECIHDVINNAELKFGQKKLTELLQNAN
jgi:Rrf2 family transcriptional regulator, nitric oxide-sensitive transcriptional repressor